VNIGRHALLLAEGSRRVEAANGAQCVSPGRRLSEITTLHPRQPPWTSCWKSVPPPPPIRLYGTGLRVKLRAKRETRLYPREKSSGWIRAALRPEIPPPPPCRKRCIRILNKREIKSVCFNFNRIIKLKNVKSEKCIALQKQIHNI